MSAVSTKSRKLFATLGVAAVSVGISVSAGSGVASAQPGAPLGEKQVCGYTDANFEGDTYCTIGEFDDNPAVLGIVNQLDPANDKYSSIRIQPGYTVRLHVDSFLQGRFIDVTGEVANFKSLPGNFNDQVSSYSVRKTGSIFPNSKVEVEAR